MENLNDARNYIKLLIEKTINQFKNQKIECWCKKDKKGIILYSCQNCAYKQGYLKSLNYILDKLNKKVI